MPGFWLINHCSALPRLPGCHVVYITQAHWSQKIQPFALPPLLGHSPSMANGFSSSLSNNLSEAMKTGLIKGCTSLSPLAKQSQQPQWGATLFYLPQDTICPGMQGPLGAPASKHFPGENSGFYTCPRPNIHETLNSIELFKTRGLASLWRTITLKACCISFALAVFQSSWETENKHTAVQLLPFSQSPCPVPNTQYSSHRQESQVCSGNRALVKMTLASVQGVQC